MTTAAIGFAPWASAAALKIALEWDRSLQPLPFRFPATFYPLAGKLIPWFAAAGVLFGLAGLYRHAAGTHRFPAG